MAAIASRKPDRFTALAGSAIFHALLLGIFFATMVELPKTYDDIGGDGIVLNYGVDPEGDGDVQTTAAANNSNNTEDSAPSNEDPQPQPETTPEPQTESEPTPEDPPTMTSDAEETVAIPVVEKPKKVEPKPEKEQPKVVTPPKPAVNPTTVYNPNKGGNGTAGSSNQATGNNNGDRPGKVGDQGDPNGSLDSRALYGTPGKGTGGNGGGSLQMVGWTWEQAPNVRDVSSESGKIVFEISVDANGEVQGIKTISSTVGPDVQQIYRDALENTSFVRTQTAAGTQNKGATGRVTFLLRSR